MFTFCLLRAFDFYEGDVSIDGAFDEYFVDSFACLKVVITWMMLCSAWLRSGTLLMSGFSSYPMLAALFY